MNTATAANMPAITKMLVMTVTDDPRYPAIVHGPAARAAAYDGVTPGSDFPGGHDYCRLQPRLTRFWRRAIRFSPSAGEGRADRPVLNRAKVAPARTVRMVAPDIRAATQLTQRTLFGAER